MFNSLPNLEQGFIPTDQTFSKALRACCSKLEIDKNDVTLANISEVHKLLEQADHDIQAMVDSDLIREKELYVATPAGELLPYTGDYDMYSISNRDPEHQHEQLNVIRGLGRHQIRKEQKTWLNQKPPEAGDGESEAEFTPRQHLPPLRAPYTRADIASMPRDKNPFVAMANQQDEEQPDGKEVHKLFGNISRYEMGMKIDLNAAAITWGGYKAGQVIKHGAESRNFAFPQEILDGIVEVNQKGSVYKTDAIDEKVEGHPGVKFYNPSLLKIAERLALASHELPLNPRLVEAIREIQPMLPPFIAGKFNVKLPPIAPADTSLSLDGGGSLRGGRPSGPARGINPKSSLYTSRADARDFVAGSGSLKEPKARLTPSTSQKDSNWSDETASTSTNTDLDRILPPRSNSRVRAGSRFDQARLFDQQTAEGEVHRTPTTPTTDRGSHPSSRRSSFGGQVSPDLISRFQPAPDPTEQTPAERLAANDRTDYIPIRDGKRQRPQVLAALVNRMNSPNTLTQTD